MTNNFFVTLEKIVSPVVFVFPNGEKKEYRNGKEAVLDNHFDIEMITVENGKIVISLKNGDSDEDWIKKHVEKYGVEPNLFDGV